MGTTVTVIYPDDPAYQATQETMGRLAEVDGLAAFLGFPENEVFAPHVRIRTEERLYWGDGLAEPFVRHFAIEILDAHRTDDAAPPDLHPAFTSSVPEERVRQLEELLGTRLLQVSFTL